MGLLNLLIANASETFTDVDITIIQAATKRAEAFIADVFEFEYSVDIVVTSPSLLIPTIPEDGIGARTYSSRLIVIVIDKQQKKPDEDILFETICHEMSHSYRWEKLPEYANTLFEGMILEGLAVVLEEKALADGNIGMKQFFLHEIQSTPQSMIDSIVEQLSTDFDNDKYDYETIFFSGNDKLPRWAGYRLGYYYVKKYLEQNGNDIAKATVASYKSFSV